jgi:putative ABC transport system permease protein
MINNYIKLALKVLARRKFFTFISLFGISLTLVVLMVVTAILDNIFTPRQPQARFDRVLVMSRVKIFGPEAIIGSGPGYGMLDKYVRPLPSAEKISFFTDTERATMYHDGRKLEARVRWADAAYWQVLNFRFLEGGPFTDADDANANRVAVISEDLRSKLFGASPGVSRTFDFDGQRFRVVGVVPTTSITRLYGFGDIWIPNHTQKGDEWKRQHGGSYNAAVMVRSAADFPKVRAELARNLAGYVPQDPKMFTGIVARLDTPFEYFANGVLGEGSRQASIMRAIFATAALLFMSLATMNLVSINLSRIMERASEIGVRKAFGASSRTLIGQFVLENTVLTLIGGLIGFVLSIGALKLLAATSLLPNAIFEVNLRVFGYGMLLAAIFGVVSGVYPAWRMSRMQPVIALRGGVL